MSEQWVPSNIPVRYDERRVATLGPVRKALDRLELPPLRLRKLSGILGALEMQIEDGGDSPAINALLLRALRAAIVYQVGEFKARDALQAVDAWEDGEAERWELLKTGRLPPIVPTPGERLSDLVHEGHRLERKRQDAAACDVWLQAWEIVKQLVGPEIRSSTAFDEAHTDQWEFLFNWSSDLELALHNAGIHDPAYHEHRVRYARELLALFPDEEEERHLQFRAAEGQALWYLGQHAEAERVFADLVDRMPDEGWAYIHWADRYWLMRTMDVRDFARGEEIMRRALARPHLRDRADVLERLADLYGQWGKRDQQRATAAQMRAARRAEKEGGAPIPAAVSTQPAPKGPPDKLPGRNDPCWCGSGKKYKHCHRQADRSGPAKGKGRRA